MGKKPHDVARGFDELDPNQFAGPDSDRSAQLADDLSRSRDEADTIPPPSDTRRPPTFSVVAAQLPVVEREIAQVRNDLEILHKSGDTEAVDRLERHLASLQNERVEIAQAMDRLLNAEAEEPAPQVTGRYRLEGQSPATIKEELTKLPGWHRFRKELDKGLPGSSRDYLDAMVNQVQAGILPVERGFWFRNSSTSSGETKQRTSISEKSSSQGNSESKKSRREEEAERARREREAKYFDADDAHAQRQMQDDIYGFERPDEAGPTKRQLKLRRALAGQNLPRAGETGYDSQDETNRSGEMASAEEQPKKSADQDPWRHIDTELGDDLKDILAGRNPDSEQSKIIADNDTEAYYGVPSSPLQTEASRADVDQARAAVEQQAGTQEQLNRVESSYTAEFGGQSFNRGDKILYESDSGRMSEYYVLCNSIGEPPGLVVQSAANESMVFAIGGDTEAGRVRKIQDIEEPPSGPGNPGEGGPGEGQPGGPGEPGNPGEGGPRDREGGEQFEREGYVEGVPRVPEPGEILALAQGARLNVDAQIQAVAQAKEQREKFFGKTKRDQASLEQANQGLESAYAQYMDNWAAVLADYRGVENDINAYKQDMIEKITVLDQAIARIDADTEIPAGLKQFRINLRKERVLEAREAIQKCDEQLEALHRGVEQVTQQIEIEMTIEMAQTRSKIEASQCALKVGTKSEKFRTFWRSKNGRRARLAVGAALGIAGAAIAMTGVGAGVGSAMVAGAGAVMRGTGGFMATEAGVNMLHNRRADKADERRRTEAWNSQTASTQFEAMRNGDDILGAPEAGNMSEQELAAFLEANAGALYSERVLRGALAGSAESSVAVADLLLKTQLDRVNSDAKSNRRAKRGAAVVGVAAAAAPFVLRHFFDGPPKLRGGGGNKPPTEAYSPDEARMRGILSTDKSAGQNWENMTDKYQDLSPAEKAMYEAAERAYDSNYGGALRGLNLSNAELDRLNFILGRGSVDVGNDEMVQLTRNIARQVQRGVPTEKILQLYGMPTDGLNGAA